MIFTRYQVHPLSSHLCPQRTWLWGSHVVPSFSTSSLQFLLLGGRAREWCHENSSSYTAVRNFWPDGSLASILSHGWCKHLMWGLCKSQLSTWSDSFTTWSTNLFSVTIVTHVYTPNITSTTTFIDCWPSQNEMLPWSYISVKYSMYLPCSVAQGAGTMGCSHSKYIGNLYRHQTFSYHCWFQLISQKASTLRGKDFPPTSGVTASVKKGIRFLASGGLHSFTEAVHSTLPGCH